MKKESTKGKKTGVDPIDDASPMDAVDPNIFYKNYPEDSPEYARQRQQNVRNVY